MSRLQLAPDTVGKPVQRPALPRPSGTGRRLKVRIKFGPGRVGQLASGRIGKPGEIRRVNPLDQRDISG